MNNNHKEVKRMKIFNKKKQEPKTVIASAPEEPETAGEQGYVEKLSESNTEDSTSKPEIREVPVCFSQSQINNLVIENNIMLKQIISDTNN